MTGRKGKTKERREKRLQEISLLRTIPYSDHQRYFLFPYLVCCELSRSNESNLQTCIEFELITFLIVEITSCWKQGGTECGNFLRDSLVLGEVNLLGDCRRWVFFNNSWRSSWLLNKFLLLSWIGQFVSNCPFKLYDLLMVAKFWLCHDGSTTVYSLYSFSSGHIMNLV